MLDRLGGTSFWFLVKDVSRSMDGCRKTEVSNVSAWMLVAVDL